MPRDTAPRRRAAAGRRCHPTYNSLALETAGELARSDRHGPKKFSEEEYRTLYEEKARQRNKNLPEKWLGYYNRSVESMINQKIMRRHAGPKLSVTTLGREKMRQCRRDIREGGATASQRDVVAVKRYRQETSPKHQRTKLQLLRQNNEFERRLDQMDGVEAPSLQQWNSMSTVSDLSQPDEMSDVEGDGDGDTEVAGPTSAPIRSSLRQVQGPEGAYPSPETGSRPTTRRAVAPATPCPPAGPSRPSRARSSMPGGFAGDLDDMDVDDDVVVVVQPVPSGPDQWKQELVRTYEAKIQTIKDQYEYEIAIRDAKIKKLEASLVEANARCDILSRRLGVVKANMDALKNEIVEIDEKRVKLKETLDKAWIWKANLEEKVLECEAQLDSRKAWLEEAHAQYQQVCNEKEKLQRKVEGLAHRLTVTNNKANALADKLRESQERLEDAQYDCEKTVEKLENKISELEAKKSEQEDIIKALGKDLEKTKALVREQDEDAEYLLQEFTKRRARAARNRPSWL